MVIRLKTKALPSRDELSRHLNYDPITGQLTWRTCACNGARRLGHEAGCVSQTDGYRRVTLYGRKLLAHRVIWKLVHGSDPVDVIDHINRDRDDNRIENLRLATLVDNHRNRHKVSGDWPKGVYYNKKQGAFIAQISAPGLRTYLGSFQDPDAAHTAYCREARRAFGPFFNPGDHTRDRTSE